MTGSKYPHQSEHSSKIDKLREIVRNTEDNIKETEFSKEFADADQQAMMRQKNTRRQQSIEELKEEIKEEIDKK